MRKMLIGLVLLGEIACVKKTPPNPIPEIVVIPCPPPPKVNRPPLPILRVKPDDSITKERQLWIASLKALIGYSEQLEKLLEGYSERGQAGTPK